MRCFLLLLPCLPLLSGGCRAKPDPSDPPAALAQQWLDALTLEEKVAELHGVGGAPTLGLWRSGGNPTVGIPALAMSDGPRGVTAGISTTFPVGMARGATWDPDLERRIAEAIALELRAKGGNTILAPVVETLRHPAWGRAQETYGEDPHHIAVMGVAFVEGAQGAGVLATPKHFAVNSIEDTRFNVDISIHERPLRELYLSPHRAVVDAGAGSLMSAYNSVNGDFCAENRALLTGVLRDDWGFTGLVMSDWIWGTHDTLGMADAGLNIEMPAPHFYGSSLLDAVAAGDATAARVDELVWPVLTTKAAFGLASLPAVDESVVESPAHVALALEAALASMVLLKNDGVLPLQNGAVVAVIGPLAAVANLGDEGSSNATPSYAVDPLTGIEEAAAGHGATVVQAGEAAETAAADVAVVVIGYTSEDEGEQIPLFPGGDRDDLSLRADDLALLAEVVAVQPHVVVVVEGGSAFLAAPWVDGVGALVMAWYPGMEGGTALGRLLFGDANFEGRLPLAMPEQDADLPAFDHVSHAITYDAWHGYRHLDRNGKAPGFPFGFGLSYTAFTYGDLTAAADGNSEAISVSVAVRNAGSARGAEVVQVYMGSASVPDGAERELVGFRKVWLDPGETAEVEIAVDVDELKHWDGGWKLASGPWTVEVGSHHGNLPRVAELQLP